MITPIIFPSALDYWKNSRSYRDEAVSVNWNSPGVFDSHSLLTVAQKYDIRTPIHIMVPNDAQRHKGVEFCCHTRPKNLPDTSFVKIADNVFVSSPELCFLQAARTYSLVDLVILANDLCAIYVQDSFSVYGQRRRTPVTDVRKITEFLTSESKVYYSEKALKAIKYASDCSNSPIESILAAIMKMSLASGGYALAGLRLNYDIKLSADAADFYGAETLCSDFVWPEKKVSCEYDSNLTHLMVKQHMRDKKRMTALSMSGYTVFSITEHDLHSVSDLEQILLNVRKTLGMRMLPDRFAKYEELRWDMIRNVFSNRNFRQ